ncbi:nitroreductase family protein [Peptoniphilus stercorisuis]|uniref:Nitroreductase n=1 Tax=Peptoniphilus stercorisuis TaxID=1436965 RepID=A0ABS4KDM8_9FIRM|nr:nitroreductase family protein [Peptoniphilus stercorisuis]MBP2025867.1 nitroreductase [Peptoniphilus stercorisuis]
MLKEIINSRRSVRKFKEDKVDHELLEELLKYSLMGPSYGNARPVQFVIVEDQETLNTLSNIETFGTKYIADAPAVIIIMADRDLSETWVEECSIAASYFQLLAQEAGLNTSWANLKEGTTKDGVEIQQFARELFNLPKNMSTLCMIPVGYGNDKIRKRVDFDPSPKIHYNKY